MIILAWHGIIAVMVGAVYGRLDTLNAGITCETCTVNKMAAGKLPLSFLSFSSSRISSMQERIVSTLLLCQSYVSML